MLKWLLICVVVFFGFMAILLGLGYLLQENEKTTTLLKQQLDQQRYIEQKNLERKKNIAQSILFNENIAVELGSHNAFGVNPSNSQVKSSSNSRHQKIITENLTCISSEQCLTVTIDFANVSCLAAVNSIGAAKLAKAGKANTQLNTCRRYASKVTPQCLMNLCTLSTQ